MAPHPEDKEGNIPELSQFLFELRDAARSISLKYFRSSISIDQKEDHSPVTIADKTIEEQLRNLISKRFPEHAIVGEEASDRAGNKYIWYIDPIDGTKSFISGMPLFGLLIALSNSESGKAIAGMIDIPALNETWYGINGNSFLNEKKIHTSACTSLESAQIYTTSPDIFTPDDWKAYDRLSRKARFRRFGGDCYIYGMLASGYCDLVVEASLHSYDFMALIPVIEGAGGVIRDWNGNRLAPNSDGRVVAAANMALLEQALTVLNSND